MIALEELSKIREFGERSHRMTCSDPNDPTRRTTYGDLGKLAAALEAVLALAKQCHHFYDVNESELNDIRDDLAYEIEDAIREALS